MKAVIVAIRTSNAARPVVISGPLLELLEGTTATTTATMASTSALSSQPVFDFSDDEEEQTKGPVGWAEASTYILPFGSFKGQTLGEIAKSRRGRNYLKYLIRWDQLRARTRMMINYVLAEYDNAKAARRTLPGQPY